MILFDGLITALVPPALRPSGCCTYFSFTHVTTRGARVSDHQLMGMTRMLGMAASAAGAPARMSEDWTQRAGTERLREEWMKAETSAGWEAGKAEEGMASVGGLTCM